MPGNFAIAGVGDARLDAIDQVLPLAINARRNFDLQLAVGVERARLLALLLAGAVGVFATVVVAGLVAAVGRAGLALIFIVLKAAHRPVG